MFLSSKTWGSQNWNGGIPDFIIIANIISSLLIKIELEKLEMKNIIKEEMIMMEAKACVRKYLIAILVELNLILLIIRGINIIKLISSANQDTSHLLDEIAIIVLNNRMRVNIKFLIFKNIKKRIFIHN